LELGARNRQRGSRRRDGVSIRARRAGPSVWTRARTGQGGCGRQMGRGLLSMRSEGRATTTNSDQCAPENRAASARQELGVHAELESCCGVRRCEAASCHGRTGPSLALTSVFAEALLSCSPGCSETAGWPARRGVTGPLLARTGHAAILDSTSARRSTRPTLLSRGSCWHTPTR